MAEDGFAIGLGLLALKYPLAAAVVVIVCLAAIVCLARWLIRAMRRRFSGRGTAPSPFERTARRA